MNWFRDGGPIIIRRNGKRWFGEKSVKMQLAPISTKPLWPVPQWIGTLCAKGQSVNFKNGRDERHPRRESYHYMRENKKVVELGRPGQMVRLTPRIIMDI